jgi:hypothetical protein
VNFPGVSFWQWAAMFYFNPKISIAVCLQHRHATFLYGDEFIISQSDRALEHIIDLRRNAFLSNIAHTDATVSHLDVDIAEH